MGKYTTGLGMTDAIAMMGAIEAMHECHVVLTAIARGQAHNGSANIVLRAIFSRLDGSDLPKEVKVEHVFPSRTAPTFEGLVYNLCWQLDYAIQQAYEQMTLEKKAESPPA